MLLEKKLKAITGMQQCVKLSELDNISNDLLDIAQHHQCSQEAHEGPPRWIEATFNCYFSLPPIKYHFSNIFIHYYLMI